jgi:hypothetical protein
VLFPLLAGIGALCMSNPGKRRRRKVRRNPAGDPLVALVRKNWPEFRPGVQKDIDHSELFEWMLERMRYPANRASPFGRYLLAEYPGLKPRSRKEVNSVDLVDTVATYMDRARSRKNPASWRPLIERHGAARFVPFEDLPAIAAAEARSRFSPEGRQGGYRDIANWAFPLLKSGRLAKTRIIEPRSLADVRVNPRRRKSRRK